MADSGGQMAINGRVGNPATIWTDFRLTGVASSRGLSPATAEYRSGNDRRPRTNYRDPERRRGAVCHRDCRDVVPPNSVRRRPQLAWAPEMWRVEVAR